MSLNYQVRNAGKRAGEVYIYDQIGANFWGDGISANQFKDDLKSLGQVDLIRVRVNSPGGVMFDGIAMYNLLKSHPARIEVDIDGMALSAASVIAMAGDEIRIASNAMMMIHNPQGAAYGDSSALRDTADLMDQAKVGLVNTYVQRTNIDASSIETMMDAETWFTAAEAVESGFADSVTGELAVAACFDPSQFARVPDKIKLLVNAQTNVIKFPVLNRMRPRIDDMRRRAELRMKTA